MLGGGSLSVSRMSRLLCFVAIFCGAVVMALLLFMERTHRSEYLKIEDVNESLIASTDLLYYRFYLFNEMRQYVMTGDEQYYDNYLAELNIEKNTDKALAVLKQHTWSRTYQDKLEEIVKKNTLLGITEKRAIESLQFGDVEFARELMFSRELYTDRSALDTLVFELNSEIDRLVRQRTAQANQNVKRVYAIVACIVLVYVIFTIYTLYTYYTRVVSHRLHRLSLSFQSIGAGKRSVEIPYVEDNTEIGTLSRAALKFQRALESNRRLNAELTQHRDHLEQEVNRRTQELQHLNEELDEFTYRASHDMKSPVVSVLGIMGILDHAIEEGDRQMSKTLVSKTSSILQNLIDLLDELVNLTKVENLDEKVSDVCIKDVIEKTLTKCMALEHFQSLKISVECDQQLTVNIKKFRFVLIAENFISNAVKYADPSKAEPFVHIKALVENNELLFKVEDNGLGIPEDQRSQVFGMFNRFHTDAAFGSGLGLYLVKKSASVLGGEVQYIPKDSGSIFQLSAPVNQDDGQIEYQESVAKEANT